MDGSAFDAPQAYLGPFHPGGLGRSGLNVDRRVGGRLGVDARLRVGGVVFHDQALLPAGLCAGGPLAERDEHMVAVPWLARASNHSW